MFVYESSLARPVVVGFEGNVFLVDSSSYLIKLTSDQLHKYGINVTCIWTIPIRTAHHADHTDHEATTAVTTACLAIVVCSPQRQLLTPNNPSPSTKPFETSNTLTIETTSSGSTASRTEATHGDGTAMAAEGVPDDSTAHGTSYVISKVVLFARNIFHLVKGAVEVVRQIDHFFNHGLPAIKAIVMSVVHTVRQGFRWLRSRFD
jgi:hypothetical protein